MFFQETYIETQTEYLPDLLRQILQSLQTHCQQISEKDITDMLCLCATILSRVQPSMMAISYDTVSCDTTDLTHGKMQTPQNDYNRAVESVKNPDDKWVVVTKTSTNREQDTGRENKAPDMTAKSNIFSVQTKTAEIYYNRDHEKKESDDKRTTKCEPDLESEQEETVHKADYVHHSDSVSSNYAPTVMQSCVEIFKEFIHLFVCDQILQSHTVSSKCMESLTLGREGPVTSDQDSVLDGVSMCSSESHVHQEFVLNTTSRVSTDKLTDDSFEAFSNCCQLMVDFSSFPLFCSSSHEFIDMNLYNGTNQVIVNIIIIIVIVVVVIKNCTFKS